MARILVIEDEKDITAILQILLEFGKYEVLTAMDGEQGLAMAKREVPDLILLDLLLPKMDGITVNNELLKNAKTRKIPVIIVTTQPPNENSLTEAENVKLYMQKPFEPLTLLKEIRDILGS